MRFLPSLLSKCNLGAALFVAVSVATSAHAQPPARPSSQQNEHRAADTVKFLAGGLAGLAAHEGGHLVFDAVFDAKPRLEGIRFGPFPFFAITHRGDVSPRRELTISSAGFWVQHATSEWLLTKQPPLRRKRAPFQKGVLAFNVLNSVGYGLVAFARAGPLERDTRGMAQGAGVDERAIGAIVLAPAILDGFRYFRPDARWPKWASRAVKIGAVLLVTKKR
jgi:hypothetical protein